MGLSDLDRMYGICTIRHLESIRINLGTNLEVNKKGNIMKAHEVMTKAIKKHTKTVAEKLGVSQNLVHKWKSGDTPTPIDRVIKLYKETGDIDIIKYICIHANGFFCENSRDYNQNVKINKIYSRLNDTMKVLIEANEDNHISLNELFIIMGTFNELKCELDGLINDLMEHYTLEHNMKD